MTAHVSMKLMIAIVLCLATGKVQGQLAFTAIDGQRLFQNGNNELMCSSFSMSIRFPLERVVSILPQKNMASVDSQAVQVMTLRVTGYEGDLRTISLGEQKKILDLYFRYELDYFENELGIEVHRPYSQWVMAKSRGWFIWTFKVGAVPIKVETKTQIQLFATTLIGDEILIVNAPIMFDGDFVGASHIVNEMMESMMISKQ